MEAASGPASLVQIGATRFSPWRPLDGAMGTELARRFQSPLTEVCGWHETHATDVRAVYRDYVESGAQALTTNTLTAAVHPDGARLVESAVRLAVGASEGLPVFVSIAPLGDAECVASLAAIGAGAGAAAILLETATGLDALAAAVRAVRARVPAECGVIASVVCRGDGDASWDGEAPGGCALALRDAGADAIGVNCAAPPAAFRFAAGMADVLPAGFPLVVRPSAGKPVGSAVSWSYPWEPPLWAEPAIKAALSFHGRLLVGGCCGAGPDHIAALAIVLRRVGVTAG
jgi:methionine synthase I (cobalamin-dependent)